MILLSGQKSQFAVKLDVAVTIERSARLADMLHLRDEIPAADGNLNVLITGASGALGSALARLHANPGTMLSLWGRDETRLNSTSASVRANGADTRQRILDFCDGRSAVAAVEEDDRLAPFDLAYLVAGIGDIRAPGDKVEDPQLVIRAAQVNFAAPAAMAAALAGRMAERGHGRIVLVGSAAGHHSLPFAASYSGSKAGLARFAQALRLAVKPHGVSVTLVAPGFIDTPAARQVTRRQTGGRPLEIPVDEAARRIARAAALGKRHYITPWPFAALRIMDALLPAALRDRVLASLKP